MPLFHQNPDSVGEVLYANLGCYMVGSKMFYGTVEAFQESNLTGLPVHHSFYDDVFRRSLKEGRWKNLSLSNLYLMRALQLREQYDVIAVNFSGGWDSRNILDAFELAGVDVDFIVIWSVKGYLDKGVAGSLDPGNWITEITEAAIPYAKEFCARNPKTKVIIIDKYTDTIIEDFSSNKDNAENIFTKSKQKPGVMYARNLEFQNDKDIQHLLKGGKTACLISGTDKPIIRHVNLQKAFGVFPEQIHSKFKIPRRSTGFSNNIIFESFYWTPYLPELAIRGWHDLYKLALTNDLVRNATDARVPADLRTRYLRSIPTQNAIKKMLYPQFDERVWSIEKPKDCGFLVTVEIPMIKVLDALVPKWRGKFKEILQGAAQNVGAKNMIAFDDGHNKQSFEYSSELGSLFSPDYFVKFKPASFISHELDLAYVKSEIL